jgi:hypothetical protein
MNRRYTVVEAEGVFDSNEALHLVLFGIRLILVEVFAS